ncbi:MAG: calcium:proton antiporter, partial [Brevibacterium aurantiacum]
TAIIRLVLGWGAFAALLLAGSLLAPPVAGPLLVTALIAIVGVILICAFGVVHEAEHLARRLGDPYGSLVLTLSIVLIEVVLIAAVLLGPGEHATIARDSVMAVSMIILGAVIGLCLLVAGLRHGSLAHNRMGVSTYLSLIIVLAALAFALPALIGTNGSYQTWQEIPIIVLTIGIYAFFLYRQMGAQAADFHEVDPRLTKPAEVAPESASTTVATTQKQGIVAIISTHRAEIIVRLALLITTVTPIVLLSHDMASLLDDGLGRLGAPVALSGVVIALIVFLPETITSIRAAWQGEIQRVSNLCHGAQVSTVGLTIPTVLLIGLLTDQPIVLAESPANLLLFAVTLLLSVTTFAAKKVTAVHGAAHLVVFAIFGITLFS